MKMEVQFNNRTLHLGDFVINKSAIFAMNYKRDEHGRLIDSNRRLINEQGRFINELGEFVDIYGNRIDTNI